MLEVFSSDTCPTCKEQIELLSSLDINYKIIKIESPEFESHELKEYIKILPFIVSRADDGNLTYAKQGFHDAGQVKMAISSSITPFNMKKLKAKHVSSSLKRNT